MEEELKPAVLQGVEQPQDPDKKGSIWIVTYLKEHGVAPALEAFNTSNPEIIVQIAGVYINIHYDNLCNSYFNTVTHYKHFSSTEQKIRIND